MPTIRLPANALALLAILLWGSLAPIGVQLQQVPPFLLTGIGLLTGSSVGLGLWLWGALGHRLELQHDKNRTTSIPWRNLALGVYGLFGFHFLLFIALRHAPPVQANLVNYLWPLGIVLLAPVLLPGTRLHILHLLAALLGFSGAALAIAGGHSVQGGFAWGYLCALGSALIWSTYSLLSQRVEAFTPAIIGLCGLISGLLSILCHVLLEQAMFPDAGQWLLLVVLGLGPLGAAFYLWDGALRSGDARQIGLLSFLTPILSTLALLWVRHESPSASVFGAAALVIGGAVLGRFANSRV